LQKKISLYRYIVVLVIDAEEGPSQQDFVLAERAALTEGCGLVLCVNKWAGLLHHSAGCQIGVMKTQPESSITPGNVTRSVDMNPHFSFFSLLFFFEPYASYTLSRELLLSCCNFYACEIISRLLRLNRNTPHPEALRDVDTRFSLFVPSFYFSGLLCSRVKF
jgi:hypothetical protein